MRKELYLLKKPLLNTYGLLADLLAIIAEVDKEGLWLASNYNNIVAFKPDAPFNLYELSILQNRECGLNMFYQCPFVDFYKYRRSEIDKDKIIDFIKNYINEKYYILLNIDRQFIKEYGIHERANHEVMVYGFDDEKEIFLLCDNKLDGRYSTDIICTFEEMKNGYINYIVDNEMQDLHDSIVLIKPTNNRFGLNFTLEIFINQIKEYLNLQASFGGRENREYWIYGIDYYSYLIEYIEKILKNEGKGLKKDIRCFCALYDHKKSISFSLKYFTEKGIIDQKYLNKYKTIEETAFLIRNIMLKIHIHYSEKNMTSLLNYIKSIEVEERKQLLNFIKEIEITKINIIQN